MKSNKRMIINRQDSLKAPGLIESKELGEGKRKRDEFVTERVDCSESFCLKILPPYIACALHPGYFKCSCCRAKDRSDMLRVDEFNEVEKIEG